MLPNINLTKLLRVDLKEIAKGLEAELLLLHEIIASKESQIAACELMMKTFPTGAVYRAHEKLVYEMGIMQRYQDEVRAALGSFK